MSLRSSYSSYQKEKNIFFGILKVAEERIRTRIRSKMSWIPNTGRNPFELFFL